MKHFYTTLLLLSGVLTTYAQDQSTTHQHAHDCGHKAMMEKLYQMHPELMEIQRAVDDDAREQTYGPAHLSRAAAVVYTIPVVVHVVHRSGVPIGTAENISDIQIQAGIDHMNAAFRNTGFYNPATGADVEIEFCLAAQDPSGNFTTGITRTASNTYADLDMDTEDTGLKATAAQWNPLNYCNIWLVREICSSSSGSCGTAGYAYLASAHGQTYDGIVNEASFFGSSEDNSKVHIHEMGHYLNLSHTFEGCTNNDCTTDGDQICDTPPDNATTAITCGNTMNSCSSDVNSGPFATDQNDMIENYMDYGYQSCQDRFTPDQRTRMRSALTGVRSSLLSSPGCVNPSTPSIYFSQASASVSETFNVASGSCSGYKDITVTMSIGTAPTGDANITINYAGSASGSGVDYTEGTAPEITFPSGSSNDQSFTIRIWDDSDVEGDETIVLTYSISGSTDAVAGSFNQTMVITINDDDLTPDVAGRTVLVDEDFSGGFPTGWSHTFFSCPCFASDQVWRVGTNGLTGNSIYISEDGTSRADNLNDIRSLGLTTSNIDATSISTDMILEFDLDIGGDATNDNFEIFYNINGSGWFTWLGPIHTFSGTYRTTLPVGMQGNNFELAFIWNSNGDGSMIGDVPALDNIKIYTENQPAQVETVASSEEVPFGPNSTIYVYSGSENDIVAKVTNNTAWDYGCTTFEIDRTGTGATQYLNSDPASFLTDKTLLVTPTNNNPAGSYNIRLYYSAAEIAGWETATSQSRNDLTILKAANPISTVSGNTEIGSNPARGTYNGSDFYVEADFTTGFSGFGAFAQTADPLPVELMKFRGKLEQKSVLLEWQTASEINSDYFILERSADGINFEVIAEVKAVGNSTTTSYYEEIDQRPLFGENYYRLTEVDLEGNKSIVGQTLVVIFDEESSFEIRPNPVDAGLFTLDYYSNYNDLDLSADIYSVDGRLQQHQELKAQNGLNQYQMDVSNLGEGVYILKLTRVDGKIQNLRFVILR